MNASIRNPGGQTPTGTGADPTGPYDSTRPMPADEHIRTSYTAGGSAGVHYHPFPEGQYAAQARSARAQGEGKSFLTAALLSILVGTFGVDRFYLGKIGTGVLKLVTLGGLGLWWLIDVVLILLDQTRDSEGRELQSYEEYKTVAFVVAGIVAVLGIFNGMWFPFALI